MLRFKHKMRPRKIQIYPSAGNEGRIRKLRLLVSGLIRYERIEPSWAHADETRQYAERLIYLAVKYGDKHKPTMELADYWLLEKDLIHKLFKVLVPRYQNMSTSYTDLHKQAVEYPGSGEALGVLELKGNPWPPVAQKARDTKNLLSNILLAGAKKDFYESRKQQKIADTSGSSSVDKLAGSVASLSVEGADGEENLGSSVDPPSTSQNDVGPKG